jgi:rhomboid family GlyGly-CTERM serine protease
MQMGQTVLLEPWIWSREAIAAGEFWRLLTGHVVHLDLWHFAVNGVGALALWIIFRKELPVRYVLWVFAGSLLAINIGLWYFSDLSDYAGLSGVLHGIAAAGIYRWIQLRDPWGWVLAVLGVSKLAMEHISSPTMLDASYRLAAEAHLFGAIGGLSVAVLSVFFRLIPDTQEARSGHR